MAEINFSFSLGTTTNEYPKLLARLMLTILIACMLKLMIYTIFHGLPRGTFWSLAHEDLNDYNYEFTNTLEDGDVCCICQDDFAQTSSDSSRLCTPIRLQPCTHVLGDKCFSRWITSLNDTYLAGGIRCPYCSQPVSRKPKLLYRHLARFITTLPETVRHVFGSIYLALLHFHSQQPTQADHNSLLQRLQNAARRGTQFLRVALWLLNARMALLLAADVLRCIHGLSHVSIRLFICLGLLTISSLNLRHV